MIQWWCDHPGEDSSEKNCCWWLTFQQHKQNSFSEWTGHFQNYPHPDNHTIRTSHTPGFKPFTMETVLAVGCFFQSGCTNCIYSNWRSKVLKPQRCSYPTPKPIPTFIPWPRHASFYKLTNFGSGLTRVCVLINYIYLVNNWCITKFMNLWLIMVSRMCSILTM